MKNENASLRTDDFGRRKRALIGCLVLAAFLQGVTGCLNWPTIPSMKVVRYLEGPYEVLVSDSGGIAISLNVISPVLFDSGSSRWVSEYGTNGIPAFLYAAGSAFCEYVRKRLPAEVDAMKPQHIMIMIDDLGIDDFGQGVWFLVTATEARQKNLWFSVETDEISKTAGVTKYTDLEDKPYRREISFPYNLGTQMIELSLSTENARLCGVWW